MVSSLLLSCHGKPAASHDKTPSSRTEPGNGQKGTSSHHRLPRRQVRGQGKLSRQNGPSPQGRKAQPGRTASRTQDRFGGRPILVLRTSLGDMEMVLFPEKAPRTVRAVLALAQSHRYDGTIFHRVLKERLIQGGSYEPDMKHRPLGRPILNEADNGLHNLRSTIALARPDSQPDMGTGEFFINLSDNLQFDHRGSHPFQRGYTVFGRVIRGMDVADRIGQVSTCRKRPFFGDVPCKPVVIMSLRRTRPYP